MVGHYTKWLRAIAPEGIKIMRIDYVQLTGSAGANPSVPVASVELVFEHVLVGCA